MQSISSTEKRARGRPRKDPIGVHVTFVPEKLSTIDAWISRQEDPKPSRPEAIRRLVDQALAATRKKR